MSEQELPPVEGEAEGVVAPEAPEEQTPPPKTVEDYARERGWKPKDEYSGDDWRDAETFLSFGLDKSRDLSRTVRDMNERLDRITRTTGKIVEDAADRARREERERLEEIHRQAVEEGDAGKAWQAVERIAELKQPAPNDRTQTDPLVERFVTENEWFNSDPQAKAIAVAACEVNKALPIADQLEAAKKAVFAAIPKYAPQAPKAPPTLTQPGTRVQTPTKRAKGFSDLPREAQEVCRSLVSKGLATQDGYVRHYFEKEQPHG